MRIKIREQLSLIVALTALASVGVVAIVTWFNNESFVKDLRSSRLSLVAELKSAQLGQTLLILYSQVASTATRVTVQSSLQRYYGTPSNNSASNWARMKTEQTFIMDQTDFLLDSTVFDRNFSSSNVTYAMSSRFETEMHAANLKLPDILYPQQAPAGFYAKSNIDLNGGMSVGPVRVNDTLFVMSFVVPITNNSSQADVLGYLSMTMDIKSVIDLVNETRGLGTTGQTSILGPPGYKNLYPIGTDKTSDQTQFRYVLAPQDNKTLYFTNATFGSFPVAKLPFRDENAVGANINTHNNLGQKLSLGYSHIDGPLVDWSMVVQQEISEALAPIIKLRNILLACVFGTCGLIVALVWPMAHYAVKPIVRLKRATEKTTAPPSYSPNADAASSYSSGTYSVDAAGNGHGPEEHADIEGGEGLRDVNGALVGRRGRRNMRNHSFRIPGKVRERKHLVSDELTDLTHTFNEMSDELYKQYENLESRVRERTKELEIAKTGAEAANEAKSLFIANITHELRTPLNGILGMCAVCMHDDDLPKIKKSLGIVYKSGELLLHLLTDLLDFSRNQIGHSITLDEREFKIQDLSTQILAIFDKQAKENRIDLGVKVIPEKKVLDMVLYGDANRILQVIINLVNNSLKFTPEHGSVQVRIICANEMDVPPVSKGSKPRRGNSRGSKHSSIASSFGATAASPPQNRQEFRSNDTTPLADSEKVPNSFEQRPGTPPIVTKMFMFEFQVEDTGPGIPEHMQQKVFEPFVQGDLGLSKKHGGTGLGLSICAQLATLMGGGIELKSLEKTGSTFTLRIPLKFIKEGAASIMSGPNSRRESANPSIASSHRGPDADSIRSVISDSGGGAGAAANTITSRPRLVGLSSPFFAPSVPPQNNSTPQEHEVARVTLEAEANRKTDEKIRVLVAEDNKVNQEVVLRMLKLEDVYDVTIAKDGQEAVDRIKEAQARDEKFDIVFMDIQMPNLDGIQSTKIIRQELGYNAPIVALTSFAHESNVKECYDAGMNFFLAKPIQRPQLKQVLKTYCTPIKEEDEPGVYAENSNTSSSANPLPVPSLATANSPPTGPHTTSSSSPSQPASRQVEAEESVSH